MDFPSPKSNIEKLHTYKPNFGKSKINNLIRLSANSYMKLHYIFFHEGPSPPWGVVQSII